MTRQRPVTVPILAPGTRYRWDKVREQHQLVFPEGMIVLDEPGKAIVQLCDGRTTDEVVATLKQTYPGSEPTDDVYEFLQQLVGRGLIREGALGD
ncbi:MAG: pyrroloquinoline quinone biosynthesis peptide chaperone PqqD [Acidobacteriota bacterium]|nr:pyrroloquinoline quinone biosynthesis peptide chaperone PqqD [Acidobacteriota bacterium]